MCAKLVKDEGMTQFFNSTMAFEIVGEANTDRTVAKQLWPCLWHKLLFKC